MTRSHGTPDPAWLADNLRALAPRTAPLLVCGRVAQATYAGCGHPIAAPVLFLPHPAARTWTREQLSATATRIAAALATRSHVASG